MQNWEPGTEFAGLVIDTPIGRGGMSVLYRAVDPRLDRPVALKVMAPELSEDPDFRVRFTDEARSASQVEHPHIVPIYAFGEEAGSLYIAMRLIDGRDLAEALASDGPFDVSRAALVLGQVADALDAIHRAGLIHRDVKSANVLLTRDDSGAEFAYLTDFGLSRSDRTTGVTRTGHFVGTVDYASPEQFRGGDVTTASDVYSFTVMLYECLTGTRPFVADSDTAVMYGHAFEEPTPITTARPDLPSGVDAVVRAGLAKDPAHRYRTCGELMRGFRYAAGLDGPPADTAGTPGGTADPGTIVRERDHGLAAAPPASPASRGAKAWIAMAAVLAVLVIGGGLVTVLVNRRDAPTGVGGAASAASSTLGSSTGTTPTDSVFVPGRAPISVTGEPVDVPPGLQVTRRIELGSGTEKNLTTTVSFHNTTTSPLHVVHVEVIDKDEIGNTADIEFLTPGVDVLEEDPVAKWTGDVPPGATAELRYRITVDPTIDQQWAKDVLTTQGTKEKAWLAQHPEVQSATVVTSA